MTHPLSFQLAADKKTLELMILGDIGVNFFGDGVDAKNIVKEIAAAKTVTAIDVTINSPGGNAFDGIAIYNALKLHPATVTVHVIGMAASAASVVAMAGNTVNIATGAMMMIHKAHGGPGGNADEKRKSAAMMDKLDSQMANIYMDRTAQSLDATLALMEAETWFTAAEAVAAGLADNVVGVVDIAAHHDLSRYGYTRVPAAAGGPNAIVNTAGIVQGWTEYPAPPQTTAPTSAPTEIPNMKILAQAAGLSDTATEAEIVAKIHARDAEHKAELEAAHSQLSALTAAIGEEGDKALGAVEAYKASHEAYKTAKGELEAIQAKAETDRHAALVKTGKADGKLTPGLESYFAEKSPDELEAFLAKAPVVIPVGKEHKQPAVVSDGPDGGLKHNGKTYSEMSGREKQELLAAEPELAARMQSAFRAEIPGNSAA